MRVSHTFLAIVFISAVLIAIELVLPKTVADRAPEALVTWHRSSVDTPPINTPIVVLYTQYGFDQRTMIQIGVQWFEYAPTLQPPLGSLLYSSPPTWWIELPGGAK